MGACVTRCRVVAMRLCYVRWIFKSRKKHALLEESTNFCWSGSASSRHKSSVRIASRSSKFSSSSNIGMVASLMMPIVVPSTKLCVESTGVVEYSSVVVFGGNVVVAVATGEIEGSGFSPSMPSFCGSFASS